VKNEWKKHRDMEGEGGRQWTPTRASAQDTCANPYSLSSVVTADSTLEAELSLGSWCSSAGPKPV